MQFNATKFQLKKSLLLSVIAIGLLIVAATLFGKETVKLVTDFTYIPVSGTLVVLSSILSMRFRRTGNHGKAWLFFLAISISWFIAETTWSALELAYHENPFPSIADIFYLAGYPFWFGFLFYYIKPVKNAVTKKMILGAAAISITMMIPSTYMAYDLDPKVSLLSNVIATSYPILDSIILIPALIGIVLFFRGEVNFTWSLVCIGIVLQSMGDSGFQIATFTNTYYTGHPVDILFLWSYIFLSFGVYDHIRIFKKTKDQKPRSNLI
ncbi:MAG: hypothetical protein AUF74_01425 [Thaumarchaeota archaeon 13_1_20CM_2_38_5]|nr:MAG: hypothetical protein AUF74_01425 [Thaumarchaeota archaeon 13_1_20CM_2_38_5]